MLIRTSYSVLAFLLALLLYLLAWPTPVDPVAWQAPENQGFIGPFQSNQALAGLTTWSLEGLHGPEGIAVDEYGVLHVSTHEGWIVKVQPSSGETEQWVNTGGRPLGLVFDAAGHLIVADAYRGLLSIAPSGDIKVLTDRYQNSPILYADDVDITPDGMIYFSDASTKFGAEQFGGTFAASLLDLMEHGGHGRLFQYNPTSNDTRLISNGLDFANGVAADPEGQFILVNETGTYRVIKFWLTDERFGEQEVLIDNLPGFPDNIVRGDDGRFWVGLASTRSPILDALSDKPFLRKMVQRLPSSLRPKANHYGHVFAINEHGKVLASLQDPSGQYPVTTGALEFNGQLYISSLVADELGHRPLPNF